MYGRVLFAKELKTCCITSNNSIVGMRHTIIGRDKDLIGYLDINESLRINFDKNDILVERVPPKKISKTYMKFLKKLIINAPCSFVFYTI